MYNSIADQLRAKFLRKLVRTAMLVLLGLGTAGVVALAEKYHLTVLAVLGALFLLFGFFIWAIILPEVFFRMEERGSFLFGPAIAHTLYGYAMKLSFLPLIGPMVERRFLREKKQDPFLVGPGREE